MYISYIAKRTTAIAFVRVAFMGLAIGCSDDRMLSKDVSFTDPGLQQCYEDTLRRSPFGKPYVDEMREMHCYSWGVRSLDGIEALFALEVLILGGNPKLTTMDSVLSLPVLRWLDLSECQLGPESTGVLSKLRTPVHLNVSGNNLGDISAYSEATSLTGLVAAASNITRGVDALVTLTNATVLAFTGNPDSPCEDLEFLRANMPASTMISPLASDVRPGVDCSL
ncbi:MAG: hypothetical protein MJE77_11080 [Proteobacteria bacterium]|nr:hypothetical protein [Pseudomonadota bacterium]